MDAYKELREFDNLRKICRKKKNTSRKFDKMKYSQNRIISLFLLNFVKIKLKKIWVSVRISLRRRDGHHDSKRDTKKRLNSGGMEVKRITMRTIFARNGKHNTRKQEAEGRESFNRMSGHVFRGGSGSQLPGHLCKSWLEPAELSALCTPFQLANLHPLNRLSLSLLPSLAHPFLFLPFTRDIYLRIRIYVYVYISSHRVTHDNIGQFAYETRRYSLFQTSLFYPSLPLSLSLHAPINRCRDERSFPRWPCLSCSTGLKRERVARLNEIDCLRKNKWNA